MCLPRPATDGRSACSRAFVGRVLPEARSLICDLPEAVRPTSAWTDFDLTWCRVGRRRSPAHRNGRHTACHGGIIRSVELGLDLPFGCFAIMETARPVTRDHADVPANRATANRYRRRLEDRSPDRRGLDEGISEVVPYTKYARADPSRGFDCAVEGLPLGEDAASGVRTPSSPPVRTPGDGRYTHRRDRARRTGGRATRAGSALGPWSAMFADFAGGVGAGRGRTGANAPPRERADGPRRIQAETLLHVRRHDLRVGSRSGAGTPRSSGPSLVANRERLS